MKRNDIVMVYLGVCLSGTALAGSMGPTSGLEGWWNPDEPCSATTQPKVYTWDHFVTASIGPGLSHNNGQTETIGANNYVPSSNSNALVYGGLLLGLQKELNETFIMQFGFGIAGGGDALLKGDILTSGIPSTPPNTYEYRVAQGRLTVNGKALMKTNYHDLRPYLSFGAGVGFNVSYDFSTSPLLNTPLFVSHTKTAFTYVAGIGVNKVVNDDWQVGLGYEFADWGSSGLGVATGQTIQKGLGAGHLYVSSVQLSLTYTM